VPETGKALLAIDGFSFNVERIVVNNSFGLLGRDLMAGNVIVIGIVPLKSKVGIQDPL
jgi:hypothetical protein